MYIFNYYQDKKLNWYYPELKINLNDFRKIGKCALYLEISDYSFDNLLAVYNENEKFISTLKYNKAENKVKSICSFSMKSNIVQALVYSYYEKRFWSSRYSLKYSLLIGIDESGEMNFWNIKGSYKWYKTSSCYWVKSLKFDAMTKKEGRIADFIDFDDYKKNYYL